jgi:hypothetical protein
MSNATQDSRNSGDSRRRRSRGGSNRNKNQSNDGRRSQSGGERGGDRGPSQGKRGDSTRVQEFRPQASRPARVYSPAKLSLWQKILKAIGLYKAPATPVRTERTPDSGPATARTDARQPKSNTRNARSGEGETREPREPREPREKRQEGERPAREPRARDAARSGDRPRGGDPKSVESTRVYVGNLSYDVTEQDLQELFKGIGAVRNVEIVYNRSTHRSKGYGFVEMLRMDEAIRAVEVLHDQHFMGRKMTVSGAKSKGQDEREDKDERPERESKPIVVASATPAPVVAAAEPLVAAVAEPSIETIVETVVDAVEVAPLEAVVEAAAVETAAVAELEPVESAADLEAKYGFDAPSEKTGQA